MYRPLFRTAKCSFPSTFIISARSKSTLKSINKLLIANRGEIACRIIKTAKKLGIRTTAVYSEIDKNCLHVAQADEAYEIGPAPASQSYLKGETLLEISKKAGCQAIHPGYGFLSENVEFAEACQRENVIFIGPPASAIHDMGIKSTSKNIMSKAGVPIIEGYHGEDQNNATLKLEAERIGFPIMIKAVRGGGGKGMRISYNKDDFEEALESARTESQKSFGDSDVLLEKFIEEPRHVEVQVFADQHGNVVYLFERDCSVQRRHQKIIEEAPAPGLSWKLREELGQAAVKAAKAVGYVGAGTVEFIFDRKNSTYYFMEMNTRLQVEHPITEMITGVDLVEWQLKIASGETLPLRQEDIVLNGHSFEARIYAENPREGFLPGAGLLEYLKTPTPGEDVRVETGVKQGDEVSVYYDPMIAKLVVWGENRKVALTKLNAKLLEYNITGLETNVTFLLNLVNHPEFQAENVHTNFIRDYYSDLFKGDTPSQQAIIQASLASVLWDHHLEESQADLRRDKYNPFTVETNFRINYSHSKNVKLQFGDKEYCTTVRFTSVANNYEISCDGGVTWSLVQASLERTENQRLLHFCESGFRTKINVFKAGYKIAIFSVDGKVEFAVPPPPINLEEEDTAVGKGNSVVAPMPGVLDKLLVKVGDKVKQGDPLFVLIAMKMEHIVKATKDARIGNVFFKIGDSVLKDAVIVEFEGTSDDVK